MYCKSNSFSNNFAKSISLLSLFLFPIICTLKYWPFLILLKGIEIDGYPHNDERTKGFIRLISLGSSSPFIFIISLSGEGATTNCAGLNKKSYLSNNLSTF